MGIGLAVGAGTYFVADRLVGRHSGAAFSLALGASVNRADAADG
jgi:hypothetical protein